MANIKISELEEMTETKDNDLLVIVDSATDTTKKIKGKNAGFGGGTYIGTEQPTKESYNVWINPDEITPVQQREEIYTEEEQVVGTYLGKPLYRKSFSGNYNDNDVLLTNVSKIVNFTGMALISGIYRTVPYYEVYNGNNFIATTNLLNGNVKITLETSGSATSTHVEITLEYTKSTD